MKRKIIILMVLILTLIFVGTGCSNSTIQANKDGNTGTDEVIIEEYGVNIGEDTVSFVDGRDKEVTIKKNPQRVIVLFDSYLEVWCKSGGTVVGRLEVPPEKQVEEAKDAEIVGKLGAISLEKVLALEPDLVILNSNQKSQMELVSVLEGNKIQVIALNYFVKDDYFKMVRLFTALNEREDLYEEYAVKVKQDIEKIIEKASASSVDKEFKVLLMVASRKSITVRGSDSTVGEMLKDLNAINISDGASSSLDAKAFSMEKIIEEDPDFIFVQTTGKNKNKIFERLKKDVESNPAWGSLTAVKEGRYIFLPKELYMYKPNHRYAEAYEGLAKIIYPDVFQ